MVNPVPFESPHRSPSHGQTAQPDPSDQPSQPGQPGQPGDPGQRESSLTTLAFMGWVVVGNAAVIGVLGILSIGVWALGIAAILAVALLLGHRNLGVGRRALAGLLSGLGALGWWRALMLMLRPLPDESVDYAGMHPVTPWMVASVVFLGLAMGVFVILGRRRPRGRTH